MKELEDLYSGFTRTLSFVPMKRDKKPYREEKSKDKRKHKDYSKLREKKRNWE